MFCFKTVTYKPFDYYKCSFSKFRKFCSTLVVWIVGMLVMSLLIVLLMILCVSSIASKIPQQNKTLSASNIFSKAIAMHYVQPDVRPLKPSNHKIMNMPHVNKPIPHESLRFVEHLEVQPNYYNPWNTKEKLLLPAWRLARLTDNHVKRLPTDRSSFSSQIPRPPRLTRTLSENRRRYTETASEQPRPFNFPLDGPQPSEFKSTKNSKKENVPKVNNIQDILRQEQLSNVNQYQMPVGIHISGSFKNLQNSGISNVFRKYVQLQPQMAPSQFNYQRMAFDPFYPYKPKSLNEINSLAMKQLGLNRSKNKKKNKTNIIPGLIFQQSGHRPVSTDFYLDALRMNNSLNSIGSKRNLKKEPFSLKLEVYPIRSGKKTPVLPMAEAQFVTTIRPNAQNFEPLYPQFGLPYAMPVDNGASYLNYVNSATQLRGMFPQMPHIYSSAYQRDKFPLQSDGLVTHKEKTKKASLKKSKSNAGQLMVHLNVFPSKKENPVPVVVPQNHLYDIIQADVHERSSSPNGMIKNETVKTNYTDCEPEDELGPSEAFEYHHRPIGKDTHGTLQNLAQMVGGNKLESRLNETTVVGGNSPGIGGEQLSTFRFPVENLMQFQANDAVI